ncbi:hypothetical protein WJX73_009311 [Symbiochloris irregularis]|uniref:Cilia- and flagella-associated protein 126 n=1 Tax=Symbiochloris irregularis TaxID=706552 RepID=A0AAW1PDB9_9CHLO
MASIFPANQYNKAFRATRLSNWERPAEDKELKTSVSAGTLRARSGRTETIVDESGHLLNPTRKIPAAFTHNLEECQKSSARWPRENPAIQTGGAATMGSKGVTKPYYFDNGLKEQKRFG